MVNLVEGAMKLLLLRISKAEAQLVLSSVALMKNDIMIIYLLEKFLPQEDKALEMKLLTEKLNLQFVIKERRRYSIDFMVLCCLLFTILAHAY